MANLQLFDPFFRDPFFRDPFAPEAFESTMRRMMAPMRWDGESQLPQIRIDVDEDDKAYTVRADIPGVAKDDIRVEVKGNVVRIDAEVRKESETKGENGKSLRKERYYGALSRAFSLATDIDDSRTEAKYENGVLTLTLPKKETAGSKRIAIR